MRCANAVPIFVNMNLHGLIGHQDGIENEERHPCPRVHLSFKLTLPLGILNWEVLLDELLQYEIHRGRRGHVDSLTT